jgi:hypothetical protein
MAGVTCLNVQDLDVCDDQGQQAGCSREGDDQARYVGED